MQPQSDWLHASERPGPSEPVFGCDARFVFLDFCLSIGAVHRVLHLRASWLGRNTGFPRYYLLGPSSSCTLQACTAVGCMMRAWLEASNTCSEPCGQWPVGAIDGFYARTAMDSWCRCCCDGDHPSTHLVPVPVGVLAGY